MKRDEIKETALKLFAQKGYTGCSMQEIADAVGLNKATLYFYFKSKDDLFLNILVEESEFFLYSVQETLASFKEGTIEEFFRDLTNYFVIHAKIEGILFWKRSFLMTLGTISDPVLNTAKDIFLNMNQHMIEKFSVFIKNHLSSISDEEIKAFTFSYFVFLQGVLDLIIANPPEGKEIQQLSDAMWQRFWNGNKL